MPRSRVDDLSPIGHLTGMRTLILASTLITDAGLAPVARFTALEHSSLADTPITDAGLKHLAALPKLREAEFAGLPGVTLEGTKVFPGRVRVKYST